MILIGIDPGVTGAITVFEDPGPDKEKTWTIMDIPTFKITKESSKTKSGKAVRTEYDIQGVLNLLHYIKSKDPANIYACVEYLQAVPDVTEKPGRKSNKFGGGAVANFSKGESMMLWKAALTAVGIPYRKVRPQTWKATMLVGLSDKSDKEAIRQRTIEQHPELYEELSRKMDHNRAESVQICAYGKKEFANLFN